MYKFQTAYVIFDAYKMIVQAWAVAVAVEVHYW